MYDGRQPPGPASRHHGSQHHGRVKELENLNAVVAKPELRDSRARASEYESFNVVTVAARAAQLDRDGRGSIF